jgi:hypothetical protein
LPAEITVERTGRDEAFEVLQANRPRAGELPVGEGDVSEEADEFLTAAVEIHEGRNHGESSPRMRRNDTRVAAQILPVLAGECERRTRHRAAGGLGEIPDGEVAVRDADVEGRPCTISSGAMRPAMNAWHTSRTCTTGHGVPSLLISIRRG